MENVSCFSPTADLLIWTKGFAVEGVVGKDVVDLLQKALERKFIVCIPIWLSLINDTVGLLIARAYYDRNYHIGLIVGGPSSGKF